MLDVLAFFYVSLSGSLAEGSEATRALNHILFVLLARNLVS